ncbi:glycosyltransferase family 4 protein [Candidatus Sumerlaeota bacterium]|nr:glycosyltransferase family 4 protein [Candidatus Sumerlaeota bacterium]
MILGIFTDVLGHGGVQRFGRQYAIALQQFADQRGEELVLLSLNDPEGEHTVRSFGMETRIVGFSRSRSSFVKACLAQAKGARFAFINHAFLGPIGMAMRLRNRALRYIVAVYGIEVWSPLSYVRRMGLKRAATVLTIAQYNRDHLRTTQGISNGPSLEVIPPPYESTLAGKFANDDDWQALKLEAPFVLCVCRINQADAPKRVESLIRAWGKLQQDFPQWTCCHVGNGSDRPRLEALARDCAPRFRFLGPVSDDILNRLYQACGLFVMPSEKEGFGIVFLEAMAHGKPVIGGNAGGTPDIIPHGEIGYLVEPRDVEALAGMMRSLMSDDALRATLGSKGRTRLNDVYTPEKFLASMNTVLARM